jgi:integrase/recombinase XerD
MDDEFRVHLQGEGLAPKTIAQYLRWRALWGEQDPVTWFQGFADADTPKGTVTASLAAVRHYLRMQGRDLEAAALKAPRGTQQRTFRKALNRYELDVFMRALQASRIPQPSRTILQLLPHTGLRIGEACALRHDGYEEVDGMPGYHVRGKRAKRRWIPFNANAMRVLALWERSKGPWVFPAPGGEGHAKTNTVQAHLRDLRDNELPGSMRKVTAHVLRHTFATMVLESATEQGIEGETLVMLKDILGHENIETTLIYAKPTARMLGKAVRLLDDE